MPIHTYECLFLMDSTKSAGNVEGSKTLVHSLLEKYHCEVLASRPWEDRRLAYPVKGQKKGLFYLVFFKAESLKMRDMDLDIRLNENVLRHMVTLIDPKWEAAMLEVARDEHRSGLQCMREEGSEGGGSSVPGVEIPPDLDLNMDGDKPRPRGRRGETADV